MTRRAVLTLYPHRPAEVGLPSENPNLNEPGLVLGGFVERVGDPVPLVAPDGSSHSADLLMVEALAAMFAALGAPEPTNDLVVAVPAYWSPVAVRALSAALRTDRRLSPNGVTPRLVSDATTALTALQANPGLAAHGVVVLLDFGGSGTSITLADAGAGFAPLGETLRYPDFSGDQIDQALLATVIEGITSRGEADPAATAAVGSLARLRDECRRAKERLSADTATTVPVDLPGYQSEIRLTRAELEAVVAPQLDGLLAALDEHLDRHRLLWSNVAAVATIGGGASIPLVTQRLSEKSQVGVVTTPRPDLDAVVGAALTAARGPDADAPTGIATAVGEAATAAWTGAAAPVDDAPAPSTFRALAWSEADDAGAEPLPYTGPNPYALDTGARPEIQYTPAALEAEEPKSGIRLPQLAIGAGVLVGVVALGGVAYSLTSQTTDTEPTTTPTVPSVTVPALSTTVEPPPPPPPPPPAPEEPPVVTQEPVAPPPVTVTTVVPPPETTTTTTTTEPTTTEPTTTTTTEPTTTTTTPPTTTTTTTPPTTTTTPPTTTTTRTPPTLTTTHLVIPGLPPIPIPVPGQPQPAQP